MILVAYRALLFFVHDQGKQVDSFHRLAEKRNRADADGQATRFQTEMGKGAVENGRGVAGPGRPATPRPRPDPMCRMPAGRSGDGMTRHGNRSTDEAVAFAQRISGRPPRRAELS